MFKKKNVIRIGKIVRVLKLKRSFHSMRWKFKRVFFRTMRIDLNRMLNPHIVIIGESGSGKSNACKSLLGEISSLGMNFIVFDAHNEYLGIADSMGADVYDASHSGINMFDIKEKGDKEKANEIAGMLKRILRLGYLQTYVLYKVILYTYRVLESKGRVPNIHDLMYSIRVFERNASRSELNVLRTLEHRLTPLTISAFAKSVRMEEVMQKKSVFALSRLGTAEAQAIYTESFLRSIYANMLGMNKQAAPRIFIVIEEAGRMGEGSTLARITAEGRKYGIGVIAIAQRAKALDKEIRSNAELLVAFYQREPEELNYLANIIAGGNEMHRFIEIKRALRGLGRGSAIVVRNRNEPEIVRFGVCQRGERSLTLEMINLSRNAIERVDLRAKLTRMGFKNEEIEGRIQKLMENKTLGHHSIPHGKYQGDWCIAMPRNSAEHDIYVSLISRHLNEIGVRNAVYNNSFGPDVIAFANNRRYAIEYETGTKNTQATKRMLEVRSKSYPRTVVIVNDAFFSSYAQTSGVRVLKASNAFETLTQSEFSWQAHPEPLTEMQKDSSNSDKAEIEGPNNKTRCNQ